MFFSAKTILIISWISFSLNLAAQDVIILRNGQKMEVIVQEIGLTTVKYIKFDNQSGPTYIAKKTGILMIKYANGSKDVFETKTEEDNEIAPNIKNKLLSFKRGFFTMKYYQGEDPISKSQIIGLLKQDPQAFNHFNAYRSYKSLDRILNAVAWMFTVWTIDFFIQRFGTATISSAIGGIVSGILSNAFGLMSTRRLERSIDTYNNNLIER